MITFQVKGTLFEIPDTPHYWYRGKWYRGKTPDAIKTAAEKVKPIGKYKPPRLPKQRPAREIHTAAVWRAVETCRAAGLEFWAWHPSANTCWAVDPVKQVYVTVKVKSDAI